MMPCGAGLPRAQPAGRSLTARCYHNCVLPLLDVRNLTVGFPSVARAPFQQAHGKPSPAKTIAAVRDLSFSINAGEVLGLVGESGSGKSVTSLAIMGLLPPQASVSGKIVFQYGDPAPSGAPHLADLTTLNPDQFRQLRGSRIAMIFQEPMTALNPVMRVGDQIAEAVLAHNYVPPDIWQQIKDEFQSGTRKLADEWYGPTPRLFRALGLPLAVLSGSSFWVQKRIRPKKAYELAIQALRDVALPEPERRAQSYPHQLPGSMRQPVMIAMATSTARTADCRRPTTALDVTIQQQILGLTQ